MRESQLSLFDIRKREYYKAKKIFITSFLIPFIGIFFYLIYVSVQYPNNVISGWQLHIVFLVLFLLAYKGKVWAKNTLATFMILNYFTINISSTFFKSDQIFSLLGYVVSSSSGICGIIMLSSKSIKRFVIKQSVFRKKIENANANDFDIVISCSLDDFKVANKLQKQLELNDVKSAILLPEFLNKSTTSSFYVMAQNMIQASNRAAIIVSDSYLSDDICKIMLTYIVNFEFKNNANYIVPLILKNVDVPMLNLEIMGCIDLKNNKIDAAAKMLKNSIKK